MTPPPREGDPGSSDIPEPMDEAAIVDFLMELDAEVPPKPIKPLTPAEVDGAPPLPGAGTVIDQTRKKLEKGPKKGPPPLPVEKKD